MENKNSNFVKIIKEICDEESINCTSFSHDWIFHLSKGSKSNYIVGYQFGLNPAVSHSIFLDKCATSELLDYYNIPHVEHFFFMSPERAEYIGQSGNWSDIISLFNRYHTLVCKANEGTGGKDVFVVKDKLALEGAVHAIFEHNNSMAISPFYKIEKEYRIIMLNNESKLVFSKTRPHLIGDGKSSIKNLYGKYIIDNTSEFLTQMIIPASDLSRILKTGEIYLLNWHHNLGQGAKPAIETDESTIAPIISLAKRAAQKLNGKFISVDIIKTGEELKILEINSGVMMENFSAYSKEYYSIAKEIYREVIINSL